MTYRQGSIPPSERFALLEEELMNLSSDNIALTGDALMWPVPTARCFAREQSGLAPVQLLDFSCDVRLTELWKLPVKTPTSQESSKAANIKVIVAEARRLLEQVSSDSVRRPCMSRELAAQLISSASALFHIGLIRGASTLVQIATMLLDLATLSSNQEAFLHSLRQSPGAHVELECCSFTKAVDPTGFLSQVPVAERLRKELLYATKIATGTLCNCMNC